MYKLVIDLAHEVWNAPHTAGVLMDEGRYCALGKVIAASNIVCKEYILSNNRYMELLPWLAQLEQVYDQNDKNALYVFKSKFTQIYTKTSSINHEKAVRMALEYLVENPDVEFINGTVFSKIEQLAKEEVAVG